MIEEEYARNECGIYKIIGKYERRDPYDLCVRLMKKDLLKFIKEVEE